MCYPTAFSVEDAEIYAYQGAIKDGDQANYTFNKIEQAEAGQQGNHFLHAIVQDLWLHLYKCKKNFA
jgi:hypothetical protein